MPEWRDTLFKGRPKIGLDFFNAPRQRGNRTKCLVHSMGYGLCVDVQKSGTTQIQNVLDKGYNLFIAVLLIRTLYTTIHNTSRKIHNNTQIFYAKEDESIHLLPSDFKRSIYC